MFLRKGVLKICSKFPREHQCRSVISKKLQSNFFEIARQDRCSLGNLLYIFRTPFLKMLLVFGGYPKNELSELTRIQIGNKIKNSIYRGQFD